MKLFIKYALRKIICPILYFLYYNPVKYKIEVTRKGKPLKPGITAVVAAKNEGYTIPLCLKSLIGIADQIVCIDNGSEDETLQKMHDFKAKYSDIVEIDIISMPGALLGDCREAGLKATKHQWHLRWDADMVAKTSGNESMISLKQEVLQDDRPRAIQLPRTNLYGDLHHTMGQVVDPGEPILVRFGKNIRYREFGKFDTIKIPLYYKQTKMEKHYYFHCSGLKSDINLIHRFHYFTWREQVNNAKDPIIKEKLKDFEAFTRKRNLQLFGTNDLNSLKYRYQRQLVIQFSKYNSEKHGEYPEILQKEIDAKRMRFKVIYKNDNPYLRVDKEDTEMLNYTPTEKDINWDTEAFLNKFK